MFSSQFANIFLTYQTFINLHLSRAELGCKFSARKIAPCDSVFGKFHYHNHCVFLISVKYHLNIIYFLYACVSARHINTVRNPDLNYTICCLLRKTYQISASLGKGSDIHRFLWVIKLPESQGRFERGSFVCI